MKKPLMYFKLAFVFFWLFLLLSIQSIYDEDSSKESLSELIEKLSNVKSNSNGK